VCQPTESRQVSGWPTAVPGCALVEGSGIYFDRKLSFPYMSRLAHTSYVYQYLWNVHRGFRNKTNAWCPCSYFILFSKLKKHSIFFRREYFCLVLIYTTDWTTGVRSPTEEEDFFSSHCVRNGSGAHPASCTMGNGGPFPGDKVQSGRDADH
jgi:hypothetical protein